MFNDCLKITSDIGAILVEQLLSINGEIPLRPWAILGSRLNSRVWTLNEIEGTVCVQMFTSRVGTFGRSSLVNTGLN